jgi:hypothetical protein
MAVLRFHERSVRPHQPDTQMHGGVGRICGYLERL